MSSAITLCPSDNAFRVTPCPTIPLDPVIAITNFSAAGEVVVAVDDMMDDGRCVMCDASNLFSCAFRSYIVSMAMMGIRFRLNRVPQINVVFVFVELVLIKCLLTSFHPVLCMYGVVWIIPVIPVSATYLGSPSWRSARVPGPEG